MHTTRNRFFRSGIFRFPRTPLIHVYVLLFLLITNVKPTVSSASSSSSSSSTTATTTTRRIITRRIISNKQDVSSVIQLWGLPSSSSNSITTTLPSSSSLLRPFITNQINSRRGVLNRLRGGAEVETDDESDSQAIDETEEEDSDDESQEEDDGEDEDLDEDEDGEDEDEEEEEDWEESEEDEDEYDDEDEEEYEESEEDEEDDRVQKSSSTEVVYDELFALKPMQEMGITFGCMMLCSRIDLTNTSLIRIIRLAFLSYIILTQLFLMYARSQIREIDDKTPITITNPMSNMLQSQIASGGDMVKNMASSLLSSESTIMEYDLSQAKNMSDSLLLPMVMLYFLHFKMGQVQPLVFQTVSGFKTLFTSPLFQAYVLGKNLQRPFKQSLSQSPFNAAMQAENDTDSSEITEDDEEDDESESSDEEQEDDELSDDEVSDEEQEDDELSDDEVSDDASDDTSDDDDESNEYDDDE